MFSVSGVEIKTRETFTFIILGKNLSRKLMRGKICFEHVILYSGL